MNKAGWRTVKLGDVCKIELGKTPSRANKAFWDEKRETNNVWLSIADLLNTENNIIVDSKEYLSNKGAVISKIVHRGTLLVSFKLTLGRLAFAGRDLYTNEAIAALTIFNERELSKEFLFYFFHFFDWHKAAENDVKLKGMTLNKAKLKELSIPLPPLPEQQRIVAILDEAFAAIATARASAERNLHHTRELFESYLQSVFAQAPLSGVEGRGEGWEEKRLGEVCTFLNRGISPKYVDEGGICVLNQKCIRNHRVNYEQARRHDNIAKKVSTERFIQLGDVLVNSTGTGTLGRVAQIREEPPEPTTVDSHVTIVRPKPNTFFPDFFGYMLVIIEEAIMEAGEGCGGQTELARSVLAEKFTVSYPESLAEQQQIVAILDALKEETQRLESLYRRKVAALDELKKSLLEQAFNGEL